MFNNEIQFLCYTGKIFFKNQELGAKASDLPDDLNAYSVMLDRVIRIMNLSSYMVLIGKDFIPPDSQ